jgi:putative transposase
MRRSYSERMKIKEFRMNIVSRIKDLASEERVEMIERIMLERHAIPYSGKELLSRATIYRWLNELQKSADMGTALLGKSRSDRGGFKALTGQQKESLKVWRFNGPYRTLTDLREELMEHESTPSNPIPSESTIGRFLRDQGLSRFDLLKGIKPQGKIRLAFEAEYPQQLWMADTKGPDVYVQDPENPGEKAAAKPVVIIDDNSRYIVAAAYVIVENEYVIMELFCQAILLFGIPEMLYVDRGSSYMGKSLKRAASLIGCNIIHTSKSDCQAKGKIEKMLRTCHERFEQEMKATGKDTATLDEYNTYVQAYIGQDYHCRVHSSTGQAPEERFFSFPANLRRWIGKDSLMMIFLPVRTVKVTKVGLVHVNTFKYLVSDSALWGKKVQVRYEYFDKSKVYVWYDDKYYGEAYVFTEENDFLKRQEITDRVINPAEIQLPDIKDVPVYGRLERQLARHREEIEGMDINRQISYNREKKNRIRASLIKKNSRNDMQVDYYGKGDFGADEFIYLLMKLLRRKFTPSERLSAHTLWSSIGPVDEKLVRKTVGRLLGEEYPVEDLKVYLEEIRIAMITTNKTKMEGGENNEQRS